MWINRWPHLDRWPYVDQQVATFGSVAVCGSTIVCGSATVWISGQVDSGSAAVCTPVPEKQDFYCQNDYLF